MSAAKSDKVWTLDAFREAVPPPAVTSVVDWAERNFRVVGGKTEVFDRRTAPWQNEVLECAKTPGRYVFVKPIQSGGTTVGEIASAFWISTWASGDIGLFWPNDLKADDRWQKYTEKRLRACAPVMARTSQERFRWNKGLVLFPHLNLSQLGVNTDRNVTSDTLRGVICEELHVVDNGWTPGKLEQVFGRQRAVWNKIAFLVSNASRVGDQFHQAFVEGTQEHWEVRCSVCGLYFVMRARWEPDHPDLGGLRYESTKRPDGTYDYLRLLPTLRYQAPCGHVIHNTPTERRTLSMSGRYGKPRNTGALPNHRSFTLESVALHDTDWLDLVRQKHIALRALKYGDPTLWEVYKREQECQFWDVRDSRPEAKPIELSTTRKKDREGLANKKFRFAAVDRQQGRHTQGETPHWWLLIMDFDEAGNGLVLYEGRCESDGSVVEAIRRHEVNPHCVCVDSSWDQQHVFEFCLLNGYSAIKLADKRDAAARWQHEDGTWHCWSEPEPLWPQAGRSTPTRDDPAQEPEFWMVSKAGAFDLLAHQRACKERKWEAPSDVSQDFIEHFKAWSLEDRRVPATNEIKLVWRKATERAPDHLYCCASYVAVFCDQVELIGLPADPKATESVTEVESPSS